MPTPMLDNETTTIARALNTCIEVCTDGEKAYGLAAADVREPALKALFLEYAKQRAEFVRQLQVAVVRLGAFPENRGSAGGALHRGFMATRRVLEGPKDKIVLDECLRGERAALAAYDRVLMRTPLQSLPPEVASMLMSQRAAIEATRGDIACQVAQR